MEKITKEDFNAYRKVQHSGVINLFDIQLVSELSGLTKEKTYNIMKQYGFLENKYGNYEEVIND